MYLWSLFKILSKLAPCFFAAGKIVVRRSGEYYIPLAFNPTHVLAEFDDCGGVGVCHASIEGFDLKKVPNGFVLIVTLESDRRVVKWIASK
jgi:hypothetical protein